MSRGLPIDLMRSTLQLVLRVLSADPERATETRSIESVVALLEDGAKAPCDECERRRIADAQRKRGLRSADTPRTPGRRTTDVRGHSEDGSPPSPRTVQGISEDIPQTIRGKSSESPLSALSLSDPDPTLPSEASGEGEKSARESADIPRTSADADAARETADIATDAALLARLGKTYEAICHKGNPTLRAFEVHAMLRDLLPALKARRPADPNALWRELVQAWFDGLRARGLRPKLDWLLKDFGALIDGVPAAEAAPRRLEIHRLAPPPEPAPEPIEPEEIDRLIASALPRRMPA